VLIYRIGFGSGVDRQLEWVDRAGKLIGTVGMPALYQGLDLSPDGKRVAVHRHDANGGDVWLFESDRGTISRLTFDPTQDNSSPIWSPDGSRIVFSSRRNGKWELYVKLADGTGTEELLVESDRVATPTLAPRWTGTLFLERD
jgi:Tol biopolymer transport system component